MAIKNKCSLLTKDLTPNAPNARSVAAILSQVEELKRITAAEDEGSLSIAACRGPCALLLPSVMARFRKARPHIYLTLYSGNSSEIRPWFRTSAIDLAIITTPPTSPSFHVEPYRSEPLTAFISPTHAFAERRMLPSDEATIPLIVRAGTPTKTRTEKEILLFRSKSIKLIIAM
jgi:DNA-binding transcriptional LysR family regulator